MTREEAIKILAVLKAAYPNSYRGLTKEEANGIVSVWATQFVNIPYIAVSIAINKIISTNTFPPSISEVKDKIQSLYCEAKGMLDNHKYATEGMFTVKEYDVLEKKEVDKVIYGGKELDEKTLAMVKTIVEVCEPMRTRQLLEPSLEDLLGGFNAYLTDGGQKQLK